MYVKNDLVCENLLKLVGQDNRLCLESQVALWTKSLCSATEIITFSLGDEEVEKEDSMAAVEKKIIIYICSKADSTWHLLSRSLHYINI